MDNMIPELLEREINMQFAFSQNSTTSSLDYLLSKIGEIDFKHIGKKYNKDNLRLKDKNVILVEEILNIAVEENSDLLKSNHTLFIYNNEYWRIVSEGEIKSFLVKASIKAGQNALTSKYYKYIDELLKQFLSRTKQIDKKQSLDEVKINLKNGTYTIDQSGGKLTQFDKEDFLTYQLPFAYTPEAEAPLFQKYLNKVLPCHDTQNLLLEYVGSILTRDYSEEKLLILYGDGANGKSVFHNIIEALLGKENIRHFSLESLTNQKGYHRSKIEHVLLNFASEIGHRFNAHFLKQLASGEPIEASKKYAPPYIMKNYAKLIFSCNKLPKYAEDTNGFFRRFIIIPFEVTIPKEEQDKNLAQNIISSELSGIFNLIISAIKRVTKQGYTESKKVNAILEKFRKDGDVIELFLEDSQYIPSKTGRILRKQMIEEFNSFCQVGNYPRIRGVDFRNAMIKKGFEYGRASNGNFFKAEKK